MIFGFKVKYLRKQQGLSYEKLAERTGLSKSYLHDIEKGRKYPKLGKINALATAFGVSYDYMVSMQASKKLQPLVQLLTSNFVKEFPMELFGIGAEKIFELFSAAPDKVSAFLNTILTLTRHYQMQREHLYLTALRAYQNMYDNHFEELEQAVAAFRATHQLDHFPVRVDQLEKLLQEVFGIKVDRHTLSQQAALDQTRSYYSASAKTLYLNKALKPMQEAFLIGRELAFQQLQLAPRPYLTRVVKMESFESLLHNFQASYFSVALLMEENQLVEDIRQFLRSSTWNPEQLLLILERYQVTAEMFLQRLTNIFPKHFGMKDLFFIRMESDQALSSYEMTKELHLSQLHNPYSQEGNEKYCRRWISINILKAVRAKMQLRKSGLQIAGAQISKYWETDNEYLCLSIGKVDRNNANRVVSVTIGLLVNDQLRKEVGFLNDPNLSIKIVNTTCEQCSMPDCEARAAPPVVLEQQLVLSEIDQALEKIEKVNS